MLCDRSVKKYTYGEDKKGFRARSNYVKEDPQIRLSKVTSLHSDKLEVMDQALAYYKLSKYNNPLRIESLFSCMTTIVRSLLGKNHVSMSDLKQKTKEILRQTDEVL
jgi:hypothetical protein